MLIENLNIFIFGCVSLLLGAGLAWFWRLSVNRKELSELGKEYQSALEALKIQKASLETENSRLKEDSQHLNILREEHTQTLSELASLKSQFEDAKTTHQEKLNILKEAKEALTKEFENLAHKIFDDKQEKFHQQTKVRLDGVISPLREQLGNFHKKVEDVYDKESKQRSSLIGEIRVLQGLNQKISEDAINLTNALKGDNKAQGNWGEMVLEKVLERSGLIKGREYETQVSLKNEEGQRRNPDVIVRLPEGKDIIIDSKMALVDYNRYCAASDDQEKERSLKAHVQSVKNHIKELSEKSYEHLEGIRSLDFVLLFLPVEPAFLLAIEHDPSIFKEAFDKNIIVVSPTTLLATLRTVQSVWRYEKQGKNSEKIAVDAGRLYDHFVLVLESLEDIGKHIERAQGSYDEVVKRLSSGRGNLLSRVENLQKLGAKTKKQIPVELLDDGDYEEEGEKVDTGKLEQD